MNKLVSGEVLVDWKGDRIWNITDPALRKLNKFLLHVWERIEPIPASTARRLMAKNVDKGAALLIAGAGIRADMPEKEKKKSALWRKFFSLRDQRDELAKVIRQEKIRPEQIAEYNATIDEVAAHPLMGGDLKEALEQLKLKDMAYYRASGLIRQRDEALDEAGRLVAGGRQRAAAAVLERFNRSHRGAELTMESVLRRVNARRRRAEMTPAERERQRVPRDIRSAVSY